MHRPGLSVYIRSNPGDRLSLELLGRPTYSMAYLRNHYTTGASVGITRASYL